MTDWGRQPEVQQKVHYVAMVKKSKQTLQPNNSLQDELGFVVEIMQQIAETDGDREPMYAFLKANLV